jgi:hypothetical protein
MGNTEIIISRILRITTDETDSAKIGIGKLDLQNIPAKMEAWIEK